MLYLQRLLYPFVLHAKPVLLQLFAVSEEVRIQGVSSDWERWFSKRSYAVKHEVLSCETEVLSGETLFHWIGATRWFGWSFATLQQPPTRVFRDFALLRHISRFFRL